METNLEKRSYMKNFPPPITPLMFSIWLTYIGLAGAIMHAVFLERLAMFDWETYQRMSEKAHAGTVGTLTEQLTIWAFASDPWLGILWGAAIGTLLVLRLNTDQRKHPDYYAGRMIRRNRIVFRGFSERRVWVLFGWVMACVCLVVAGAFAMNINPKTSMLALLIPAFLSYRVNRDVYLLAKEKYTAALDAGLVENGSIRPSRGQYVNLVGALMVSVAIPICFSWLLASNWASLGELHDFMLSGVGSTRTPDEARALEERLERTPGDRDTHVILAWYYAGARFEVPEDEQDAMREGYYRHTLWLVQHAPENFASILLFPRDGEAYEEARHLWLENIETGSGDPKVLMNAARFFDATDPTLAEDLLQKGQALEPDNPEWGERLKILRGNEGARSTDSRGHFDSGLAHASTIPRRPPP